LVNVSVPEVFTLGGEQPDPRLFVYGPVRLEVWICSVEVAVWTQF
jgi:hypothetical protein